MDLNYKELLLTRAPLLGTLHGVFVTRITYTARSWMICIVGKLTQSKEVQLSGLSLRSDFQRPFGIITRAYALEA